MPCAVGTARSRGDCRSGSRSGSGSGSDGPLARGLQAQGEGLYSIGIAVDNLQDAVDAMRGQGIGVRVEKPEGILLSARPDPASTHGARLEFVQA